MFSEDFDYDFNVKQTVGKKREAKPKKYRRSGGEKAKGCPRPKVWKPKSISNLLKGLSSFRVDFRFDICIPNDCNENDLRSILNWLLGSELSARVDYCKEKNQKVVYSTSQIICLLTVPVFCLVAATNILPLLGDGPHWNDLLSDVHEIVQNWPKYVFHYNNFIEQIAPNSIKLEHLWFISALFQQTLVAIPLLYINNRWPKYGKIITVMLIVAGVASHVINTNVYKDHTMFGYSADYRKLLNYLKQNYIKPYYAHLSSFFTGFLFGCFLLKKGEIKFARKTLLVFWIVSIILIMLAIFGLHGYKRETSPNDTIVYLHHTLSPFAFTVVTAWISVACITGYGGICNRIFSLRIFCMLDKLIIWIYMLHILVLMYIYSHLRKGLYASAITLWMLFLMVMCLTLIASLLMHLFVETPLNYLIDKIIDFFCKKKKVDKNEECRIYNLRENQSDDNNKV
ncbi:O-acyltransferase like protein-like [Centruroides sculpturatus]|uniref:O-acyltransferase like protein-like n=1 Tax=Centruroides sculpturatus TaxID=218467 RepID=UPI000C6DE563|nr:O-acyltransferase like protein-like [Centruroides sculpturatus]